MKKILFSILAIALTVGLVSGTAYALFSDTATVGGMTFTSGNADVQVALDIKGGVTYETEFKNSVNFNSVLNEYLFGNMFPGFDENGYFRIKNNSKSDIILNLTGHLKSGVSGDWDVLKDKIQIKITKEDGSFLTDWYTLNQWNSSPRSLGSLPKNEDGLTYRIYVRIPKDGVGNEIAGKTLSSVNFEIVGVQQ
jgi:predicted ribosomally synthesized peptide with SipW-like signal peptide